MGARYWGGRLGWRGRGLRAGVPAARQARSALFGPLLRPLGRRPSVPGPLRRDPLSPGIFSAFASCSLVPIASDLLSPESRRPGSPSATAPPAQGPGFLRSRSPSIPSPGSPRPRVTPPSLCLPHSEVGSARARIRLLRRGDPSPALARSQAAWSDPVLGPVCRCRPSRRLLTGSGPGRLCRSSLWAPLAVDLVFVRRWGLTIWRGRGIEKWTGPAGLVPGTGTVVQGRRVF